MNCVHFPKLYSHHFLFALMIQLKLVTGTRNWFIWHMKSVAILKDYNIKILKHFQLKFWIFKFTHVFITI
jgi:hypothetical protein